MFFFFIMVNLIYFECDFIIVVVNFKEWWMLRYMDVLGVFSKYKIILLENENVFFIIYCFILVFVGLILYGFMLIDLI